MEPMGTGFRVGCLVFCWDGGICLQLGINTSACSSAASHSLQQILLKSVFCCGNFGLGLLGSGPKLEFQEFVILSMKLVV